MKITVETRATTEAVLITDEIVQEVIEYQNDYIEEGIEINVLRSATNFWELEFEGVITAEDRQSVHTLFESEIQARLPEGSETIIKG